MDTRLSTSAISFANLDKGQAFIARSDEYSKQLTRFDLQSKTQALFEINERDYLNNAKSFVRSWSPDEERYLADILIEIDQQFSDLGISVTLPDEIVLVKTSGQEEGGANGYTRSNVIYLNQDSLSRDLLIHEIYHIISRFNPKIRSLAYATLGFKECSPIEYFDSYQITNPDALYLSHSIRVTHADREHDVALIIRSEQDYEGGSFFSYVNKRLLVLGTQENENGPEILRFDQVHGLFEQIGRNTAYNIHQEEVCAVHFSFLLNGTDGLPDQNLVVALGDVLCGDTV